MMAVMSAYTFFTEMRLCVEFWSGPFHPQLADKDSFGESGAHVLGGGHTPGSRDWEASLRGRPGAAVSATLGKLTSGLHRSPVKAGGTAAAGASGDERAPWAAEVPEEWWGKTETLVSFRGDRV